MQLGLFGCACNALLKDITEISRRLQLADNQYEAAGASCVVIMGSANIASYLSMNLVYCLHSGGRTDGEDGKRFIFGESPRWLPFRQQLALLWMLFGVPEMLSWKTLMDMDPIPRVHFLMLHVIYLPLLRFILLIVGFPTLIAYCWVTFPLAVFLMFLCRLVNKVMVWEITPKMEKFNDIQKNYIKNTLRWNLVLPVVLMPVAAVGTALGVRFYLGVGYLVSLELSFLKPTLSSYVAKLMSSFSDMIDAGFQAAR